MKRKDFREKYWKKWKEKMAENYEEIMKTNNPKELDVVVDKMAEEMVNEILLEKPKGNRKEYGDNK